MTVGLAPNTMPALAATPVSLVRGPVPTAARQVGVPMMARAPSLTSQNIAYVYDDSLFPCTSACGINDTGGPGVGASIFVDALTGSAPGTGNTGSYSTADGSLSVTLTNVPLSTLNTNANALAGFDTVILYETCTIGAPSNAVAMARVNQHLHANNKAMIFDADGCAAVAKGAADWSTFQFPFATNSPGPRGASGSYLKVLPSSLTTGLSTGTQPGDSVGDANVFTTFSGSWFESIVAQNLNTTGVVMAYARTSPPDAGGLAIYEGEDFWFTFGPTPHLRQVFDNMLKEQWNPDGLPSTCAGSHITLSPSAQSAAVGTPQTVTATSTDVLCNPVSGTSVSFHVLSGPDAGVSGTGVTSSAGTAIFTLNGSTPGTDNLQAGFVDAGGATHTSNVVVVNWTSPTGLTSPNEFGSNNPAAQQIPTCNAGGPVNCATGNHWESLNEVAVPGRGVPLSFVLTYNALGAATDSPVGFGWSFDEGVKLTVGAGTATVTEENGSTIPFTVVGGVYTAPSWAAVTLTHNGDGTFTLIRLHDQRQYLLSASGTLQREIDRNGYATLFTYSGGRLTTVSDPAGRSLTFTYGSNGRIARVTDPASRSVTLAYDGAGNLLSITDVGGGVTSFTYDAAHLMLTKSDPRGAVETTHYDAAGRAILQSDPLGRVTTWSYGGGTTTITDPKGSVTQEHFVNLEPVTIVRGAGSPAQANWRYAYDPNVLGVATATDPDGHTTAYTWDHNANLVSRVDAIGHKTSFTYDALNDLATSTDPAGVTITFTYDAKGNLLQASTPLAGTTPPQAQTWQNQYSDPSHPGDRTKMIDPDGGTWSYTYDSVGDVTSTTDPLGDRTTYTFNSIGWNLTSTSPRGNVVGGHPSQFTTTYSYDSYGDLTSIVDPLGHGLTQQWDGNQNLVKSVDGNGNVTLNNYDADNELVSVTRADGTVAKTDYNADGTVARQVDGNGSTTAYVYDALQRVTSMTDPLGRTTSYSYDGAGNLVTKKDPQGQTTTYAYDPANHLTGVAYSDGKTPNVGLRYDVDGRRIGMTDGSGLSTWTYNSLGQFTSHTDGTGATVVYAYDLRGALTSITYPGNRTVTRTYDAAGRMHSVTDWLGNTTTFSYDANSNLTGETFPVSAGNVDVFQFDNSDQLMSIQDKHGDHLLTSLKYTRDANDQVRSETAKGLPQPERQAYSYTSLDQVRNVNKQTYRYDAAGNVVTLLDGTTQTFDAASQLIKANTEQGTAQYIYNASGDRTQMATEDTATAYTYDQADRLTGVGTTATYSYNGDGLRVSKSVDGAISRFTWDMTSGLPLLLSDGTNNYVYGPGGLPLEQISVSDKSVEYLHQDQLGSTRLVTDAKGNVVARYSYDPYGNLASSQDGNSQQQGANFEQSGNQAAGNEDHPATTPFLYAGQYHDSESGFYYLTARYYDPATAQFLTRDPILPFTRAPYSYVADNPLNNIDPNGQCIFICSLVGGVIGGVVGAVGGAISYGISVATGQESFNWGKLGGAVAGGAVTGAVTGACVGTIVLIAACGFIGGAAGGALNQLIDNVSTGQDWSKGLVDSALASGVGGAILGPIGSKIGGRLFPINKGWFKPTRLGAVWSFSKTYTQRLWGQALTGSALASMGDTLFNPTLAC